MLIFWFLFLLPLIQTKSDLEKRVEDFFYPSDHTNNWAILVCTSRFWYNYRHVANVLSLYHSIKRLGIPDSNIIMMLSDNIPCNPRNPDPGTIYNNAYQHRNLYTMDTEVDYRGYEVTAENFVRLITGRVHEATPRNKRLLSDHQSNVLIYLTGHGGDGFLKFQDAQELTSVDLADAIETMYQNNRYKELFVIADTCQSASMYSEIYSPNVLATSSSLVGEDSLSHHVDRSIGVYIIDRYSYYIDKFLEGKVRSLEANVSMAEYLAACSKEQCISTVGVRYDLYPKPPERVRVTDFFGARKYVIALNNEYEFDEEWEKISTDSEERKNKWTF